jgi:hypothetical protein
MTTDIYIQDNENILWSVYNETKRGIFRRKVVSTNKIAITNRRIVTNDYELSLQDISDVRT